MTWSGAAAYGTGWYGGGATGDSYGGPRVWQALSMGVKGREGSAWSDAPAGGPSHATPPAVPPSVPPSVLPSVLPAILPAAVPGPMTRA